MQLSYSLLVCTPDRNISVDGAADDALHPVPQQQVQNLHHTFKQALKTGQTREFLLFYSHYFLMNLLYL
jgi:hypothetical protein